MSLEENKVLFSRYAVAKKLARARRWVLNYAYIKIISKHSPKGYPMLN